jgi:hypothetical protein
MKCKLKMSPCEFPFRSGRYTNPDRKKRAADSAKVATTAGSKKSFFLVRKKVLSKKPGYRYILTS